MDAQQQWRTEVEQLVRVHGRSRTALMPILQDINRAHSYIPEGAMLAVSSALSVPRTEVYGVASFYAYFSVKPRGRYVIRVCRTISCAKQGEYHPAIATLITELGIGFGETTPDGLFTLEQTNCCGMCDQGPSMVVNEDVHVRLSEASVRALLTEYRQRAGAELKH
ncbi:NADH:ubiquinone oxidoreductase subunit E [Rhizomicrobium palustre]|uniref:NADH:ubiquinone oxidoreductase subunit E n=1 Tax=Rhizomicrobium palustre TaxID=189966 RepID=A0A846MYX8_9PROT|nr:NAD(P)H-dependent oxidoreductase subunit E [Rhizomicrobium palustre]NIK88425.1 NADH:ubiquinone oxidoreductase subunit E [Rhizomicrobium palustre]